jgi:hypothetical protein
MRYTKENGENIKRIFESETGVRLKGSEQRALRDHEAEMMSAAQAAGFSGRNSRYSAGSGLRRSRSGRRAWAWAAAAAILVFSVAGIYGGNGPFSIRRMLLMGSAKNAEAPMSAEEQSAEPEAAENSIEVPETALKVQSAQNAELKGIPAAGSAQSAGAAAEEAEETEDSANRAVTYTAAMDSLPETESDRFVITMDFYVSDDSGRVLERPDHSGIDFRAETGDQVLAAAAGTVSETGFEQMLGNYVIIQHDEVYTTVYGHLSEISVETGDEIGEGEVIGLAGASGLVTGPCLHFELRENGVPVAPKDYMR